MKNYELTVIFHPDLEMNIDPAIEKVRKTLEANKAIITKEEADGKKRMAYGIRGQEFGIYHYFELELPPEAPGKISSVLNISDEILRHLLTRADERKVKMAASEEKADSAPVETTNDKEEA